MRRLLLALSLLAPLATVHAQIGVEIGLPGVNIGINLPVYPQLVLVPGSPVYYAPRASSNYFFYDGLYWVYRDDNWYSSDWYNGPWQSINPIDVPRFVLRVPVRYYRQPPSYFRGWQANAAPRWGDHWGRDWSAQRHGWNDRKQYATPRPAPLPSYQRKYTGDRYPGAREQQQVIRAENYRYKPREAVTRQHFEQSPLPDAGPRDQSRPMPSERPPQMQSRPPATARENRPPEAGNARDGMRERPASPQGRPEKAEERPQERIRQRAPEREPNKEAGNARDRGQERNQDRGQDKAQNRGRDNRNDERGPDRR